MSNNNANDTLLAAIRPVAFVEPQPDGSAKCGVCEYRCTVAPGDFGACKMRANQAGNLVALNYGLISKADLELIEKKNFYHFFPGVKVFSVGGYGVNFPTISDDEQYADFPAGTPRHLPIERIAKFAIEQQCRGIVFAYNEPSMWYEFLLDACKSIRANGMFTALVTNGYLTTEAMMALGDYVDGMLMEVNAFTEKTFKTLTGQSIFQRVLDNASRAQKKFKIHVEIKTTIVPGVNDNRVELNLLSNWISKVLGPNTPWHLHSPGENSDAVLRKAKLIGENSGLNYIYMHGANSIPTGEEAAAAIFDNTVNNNTYCNNCHSLIIRRGSGDSQVVGLNGNKCDNCNIQLSIQHTLWRL